MIPIADVLQSPALPLLVELESQGFALAMTDTGRLRIEPGSRLTTEQRASVQAHGAEIADLLRVCDAGVRARRATFECQMALLGPGVVSSLMFETGTPYAAGVCFSCGDALGRPLGFGRCWRCSLAWRLAYRLPITPELADAIDQARRVS